MGCPKPPERPRCPRIEQIGSVRVVRPRWREAVRKGRQHNPGLAYQKVAPSIRRSTDGVAPRSGPLGLMQGFANARQSLAPRQAGLPQTFTKIQAKTDEHASGSEPKHGYAAPGPTYIHRSQSRSPRRWPTCQRPIVRTPYSLHTLAPTGAIAHLLRPREHQREVR